MGLTGDGPLQEVSFYRRRPLVGLSSPLARGIPDPYYRQTYLKVDVGLIDDLIHLHFTFEFFNVLIVFMKRRANSILV